MSTATSHHMATSEVPHTQSSTMTEQPYAESIATNDEDFPKDQPLSPNGVHLQVNYKWSQFRNYIGEVQGDTIKPLYIQHFGWKKPNLRFNGPDDTTQIATGTIHNVRIHGDCTINGRTFEIKPLSRIKTQYNYLSQAFASPSDPTKPVALTWITTWSLKRWHFICLDEAQMPVAQFSANLWKLVEVGNLYFERSADRLTVDQRDEIVVTALTIFYIMYTRMNNPLSLLGMAFAKPGKVDAEKE